MTYNSDIYFVQYNGETKQECVNNLKSFILLQFHGHVNYKCISQREPEIILRILEASVLGKNVLVFCLKYCCNISLIET